MPLYVSLVKFTPHGMMAMKDKGRARSNLVQRNIESLGGVLLTAYYCLGKYDAVAIIDFPSHRAALKAAVLNSSLGHIHITTMPALTRTAWRNLLRELWANKPTRSVRAPRSS